MIPWSRRGRILVQLHTVSEVSSREMFRFTRSTLGDLCAGIPPIMLANPTGVTSPPDPGQAENSRPERSKVG